MPEIPTGQVASTPDGARKLDAAVDAAPDADDDDFRAQAAADADRAAQQGGGMLQSLLGGGMTSGLASAIGKFTGLGSGSITTMLG